MKSFRAPQAGDQPLFPSFAFNLRGKISGNGNDVLSLLRSIGTAQLESTHETLFKGEI